MAKLRLKRWQIWTLAGVLTPVVAVVAFLVIWQLTHKAERKASADFTELAEQASDTTTASTPAGPTPDSGLAPSWRTITPSEAERDDFYVGYRASEVLFGQNVTATGRTRDVTGTLTFQGTTLTAAEFTARMATVTSDESRRDGQFRGRIMAVDQFPTATFVLTRPVDIGTTPPEGQVVSFTVTGDFTVRGTTKSVSIDLQAFTANGRITVTGELPIVWADWGIPEPTFGPASVEDHGSMEFLLTFEPA